MVHNGIEYGLMQAYAEGFEIMKTAPFKLDLHDIAAIWGHGSVVRSWLLELLESALADDTDLHADQGLGRGLGRGSVDRPGGHRPGRPRADHHAVAPDALPFAAGPSRTARRSSRRCATSSADTPSRSRKSSSRPAKTENRTGRKEELGALRLALDFGSSAPLAACARAPRRLTRRLTSVDSPPEPRRRGR